MTNVTLFSQIIGKLDRRIFNKLVKERQIKKSHSILALKFDFFVGHLQYP